ncbi:type I toxin-antitoxin system Ibs family toxin [Escherichia coli]|nr:type I toxin-antitoxin system Ibs family toxin [Escherichia coli]
MMKLVIILIVLLLVSFQLINSQSEGGEILPHPCSFTLG